MFKRKITKKDVDESKEIAEKARAAALFSLYRARILKTGADQINREYKNAKKKTASRVDDSKKSDKLPF